VDAAGEIVEGGGSEQRQGQQRHEEGDDHEGQEAAREAAAATFTLDLGAEGGDLGALGGEVATESGQVIGAGLSGHAVLLRLRSSRVPETSVVAHCHQHSARHGRCTACGGAGPAQG
jgi:hypothetical protein